MTSEYSDFSGFEWDGGNRDKNLKHKVQWWECEQLFFNKPLIVLEDAAHSISESRYAAFGKTDAGRRLVVVFTMRRDQLRVISSRDMSRKERTFYENNDKA